MDEFGKVCHSDYDSAEIIADSDVEDGELRKMFAAPLYMQKSRRLNHLEYQLYQGNLLHCYSSEEQVESVLKLIQEKA